MSALHRIRTGLATLALIAASASQAGTVQAPVPSTALQDMGSNVFIGPLANTARKYQWLINADQLGSLAGRRIIGLSVRLPGSATGAWPDATVSFGSFEVWLSEGVTPADRSLTFADNAVGPQQQVRTGELSVAAGSYPAGGAPNAFGPTIALTPWLYSGGHLLIELRHQGSNGISRNVEAFGTASPLYGDAYSALWTGSMASPTGAQGNFATLLITAEGEDGVVADVIIGNLPESNDDASASIDDQSQLALRFTMPVDVDVLAGALTLRLADFTGTASVELRDGADPATPGSTVLATFSPAPLRGTAVDDVVFLPDSNYSLQAGASYWLVVAGDAGQGFRWHASSPGVTPTGSATFDLYAETGNGGADWQASDVIGSLFFVEGEDRIFYNGFQSNAD